jgi:hypothetical protein
MKRCPVACFVFALFVFPAIAHPDDVLLTLDLHNNYRDDPRSGGTWQLFARRIANDKAPSGEAGIGYVRAILSNVSSVNVEFADDIGQMQSERPLIRPLSNGAVEILYQQDTAATVVEGVGVNKNPRRDRLIASGYWPPGARPKFVADDAKPTPDKSEAKFLSKEKKIPRELIPAGKTQTAVVTLGDLNNDQKVTGADIAPFVARLPGAAPALGYDPACDLDQSGTVTVKDKNLFIEILGN